MQRTLLVGVTLIEVLISFFLLSCILLGLDSLLVVNLRATKAAYYHSVAINQLHEFYEVLHVLNGMDYGKQFSEWNEQNKLVLPQGLGKINGSYPNYRLIVFWGKIADAECSKDKIGQSGCVQMHSKIFNNNLIL